MTNNLSHPSKEQSALIGAWRIVAQQKMPYMAPLLYAMTPVVVTGNEIDTLAIDSKLRLYINFERMQQKSIDFGGEALLHECGHIFGEHDEMAKTFSIPMTVHARKMWNYAGDCAINDDLRDAGCAELADHGVFAENIGMADYLTPFAYYNRLNDLTDASKQKKQPDEEKADGKSPSQPGDGSEEGENQPGGEGSEGTPSYSGCGSGAGAERGDFEIVPGSADDQEFGGMIPTEIESAIIQTARKVEEHVKSQGFVPAGIAQQANMTLSPTKTPWQRMFRSVVGRAAGNQRGDADLDMRRRDRRQFRTSINNQRGVAVGRVISFGRENKQPTAVLFRDTSGSMNTEDLEAVSNEFFTLTRRMNPDRGSVMVHDVDAQVYKGEALTRERCDVILNSVQGRGGTDMRLCFTHVENEYIAKGKRPSVVVIATDGGTSWPKEQPSYPVIVVLTKSGAYTESQIPGWATVVALDE